MSRFADYLVDRGLLSRESVERATQHQVVYGARLGTNLVELKMLGIEELAEALSDFHKVPLPPRTWLERPARNAVKRVSRPMVERIRFIPLRLDGNVLHAAVLDPTDPGALDNLRFATGCRVEPYVLPEIWMHDWLFTLFKISRGIRHVETESEAVETDTASPRGAQVGAVPSMPTAKGPSVSGMPRERGTGQTAVPFTQDRSTGGRAAGARASDPGRNMPAERDGNKSAQGLDRASAGPGIASGRTPTGSRVREPESVDTPSVAHTGADEIVLSVGAEQPQSVPSASMGASVRPPPVLIKALGELIGAKASGAASANAQPSAGSGPSYSGSPGPINIPGPARVPVLGPDAGVAIAFERDENSEAWASAELPAAFADAPAAPTAPPSGASASGPDELARLEREMMEAEEREHLIDSSFALASHFARTVALFIVQKGTVQGVRSVHGGESRPLDGLLISVELASMLTQAASGLSAVRAAPSARAVDMRVLQVIGDANAAEVGLFPITIRQRVVNLLYASNGEERLGPVAFEALTALAAQMSAGYERLIMARKGAVTNAP